MKVDKYLMIKARKEAKRLNPQSPIEGFRQYKQDIVDMLRYAHIEGDPRNITKHSLKEGRFLYPVVKTSGKLFKVGVFNWLVGGAGVVIGAVANNETVSDYGEKFMHGGGGMFLGALPIVSMCYMTRRLKRKFNGIPDLEKAKKVANANKSIVNEETGDGGNLSLENLVV